MSSIGIYVITKQELGGGRTGAYDGPRMIFTGRKFEVPGPSASTRVGDYVRRLSGELGIHTSLIRTQVADKEMRYFAHRSVNDLPGDDRGEFVLTGQALRELGLPSGFDDQRGKGIPLHWDDILFEKGITTGGGLLCCHTVNYF
jgi:hypothetical protein